MLKLKAATLAGGAVVATLLPTAVTGPAVDDFVKRAPELASTAATTREHALPVFVSTENFSAFVEATRESDAVAHDQGRIAAERLIAKFDGAGTSGDKAFLHGVVEGKRDALVAGQLAEGIKAGSDSAPPAQTDTPVSSTADPADPLDPPRHIRIASLDEDPATGGGGKAVADPQKPAAETDRRPARVNALRAPDAPPRKARSHRAANRSVVRLKRKQVASRDAPADKWGEPSGLMRGAAPPPQPDSRALGGPTQSMVPLIEACGPQLSVCRANNAWCGC